MPTIRVTNSAWSKKRLNLSNTAVIALLAFLGGCVFSATLVMNLALSSSAPSLTSPSSANDSGPSVALRNFNDINNKDRILQDEHKAKTGSSTNPLEGIRILVAIAAFDFSQIPHLEEVLDAYQDLCVTGASQVHLVIHATVAYPVTLIDILNSRLVPACEDVFQVEIELVPAFLRLHLVDCHRFLFYEKINDYDLFIYTEDDIRVSPRTVAAYLDETNKIASQVGSKRASDFNVGIVRYEYNFPSNVVMDDKTRHATQNVTRVYWEHREGIQAVTAPEFKETHVQMKNHHQGMFLATRELLLAWKDRKGCKFDEPRDRPGKKNQPSQPTEGTQRVWMSSQMLYGGRHCGVQQVIPAKSFGSLTVLHLPNKNYRRVGHFRNRTFSDGTEQFNFGPTGHLLTAMALHIDLRKSLPIAPQHPYKGITMVDKVHRGRTPLLERRMEEYRAYVDRGGVLSEKDMDKTALVEER